MAFEGQVDLDEFVARDYPRVLTAVGLISGNRRDAPDAVEDALVGFVAQPPDREIENVAAWITVVASERARELRRSRPVGSRVGSRLASDEGSAMTGGLLDVDLAAGIRALPLRQRQVCVLYYLLDQSVPMIAEGLGVAEATVTTQLNRARRALAVLVRG